MLRRWELAAWLCLMAITCRAGEILTETFDGLAPGPLDGQNGWTSSPSDAAVVQSGVTFGGSPGACGLNNTSTNASAIQRTATESGGTNLVWTDCYVRPVPNSEAAFSVNSRATAVVTVESGTQYLVVYNGTNRVVLSAYPPVATGAWVRFTFAADYSRKTWSLWMDGVRMAADLQFYSSSATRFTSFNLQEGGTNEAVAYLDALRVTTERPADIKTDNDWRLPFTESFETLWPVSADGQRGWLAQPPESALVQSNVAYASLLACRLGGATNGARLSHRFGWTAEEPGVTWTLFRARLVPTPPGPFRANTNASVLFTLCEGGATVAAYDGTNAVSLPLQRPLTTNEWAEFTIKTDYPRHTWSLWVNGTATGEDLHFYNTNHTGFVRFGIDQYGSAGAAFIDGVSLWKPSKGQMLFVR